MKLLYHYTSLETLHNILENQKDGNIILRAGYFMNMNDPFDCRYFLNEVNKFLGSRQYEVTEKDIEKVILDFGIPYFISFSSNQDSLPMWKMYGDNGRGCALVFSEEDMINLVPKFQDIGDIHQRVEMKRCFCKYLNCHYWGKNKIHSYIKTNFLDKQKHMLERDDCLNSYCIKHKSYAYENESRIVLLRGESDKIEQNYLEFLIPLSTIKYIDLGPCANKSLYKKIVPKELFDKIRESQIPYTDSSLKTSPKMAT